VRKAWPACILVPARVPSSYVGVRGAELKAAMRNQWQTFLELIWPSRYDPIASSGRRMALLQAVIAMAIALAAGPEIFLAMEMTAVLELLGAILFLTAMAAGAKLVAMGLCSAVYDIAFPIPAAAIVRCQVSMPAKALALICVTGHAAWCVALALNCTCVGATGVPADRSPHAH